MKSWLIDKSGFGRLTASVDREGWATRIERGLVRLSTVTRLEVGFSARTAADLQEGYALPLLASMPVEYLTPRRSARS